MGEAGTLSRVKHGREVREAGGGVDMQQFPGQTSRMKSLKIPLQSTNVFSFWTAKISKSLREPLRLRQNQLI